MSQRLALPTPADIGTLDIADLPAVLVQLAALQTSLAARLLDCQHIAPTPAPTPEHDPLTQEEAASRYRLPLRSLRRLTRTRRVPSYLQGRNRMIRPADLDRYFAQCREQGVKVGTRLDAY